MGKLVEDIILVHPSTLNYLLTSRIDASYTCSKQHQQGPTCLFEFAVNKITLITETSTLTSSAYNGKKFHTPDLPYVEYASFWILTPF